MAQLDVERGEVRARILYWGIAGAGKSTNLEVIHARLRPDRRGELRQIPTRLDPTVYTEILPIELGEVSGHRTQLQVIAVPGATEQAPTRVQLLDEIDGIVLVVDCQADRLDENVASVEELRSALEAYGRSLDTLPLVVQYNKRDLGDPYALEELHRRLGVPSSAVFEAVASEGSGVLQTLTTISKRVVRVLREDGPSIPQEPVPTPPELESEVTRIDWPESDPTDLAPDREASQSAADLMESAILAEGENLAEADAAATAAGEAQRMMDQPETPNSKPSIGARIGADFRIASVGQAERTGDRSLRLPLVLGNDDGETVTLQLTIALDPLLDDDAT